MFADERRLALVLPDNRLFVNGHAGADRPIAPHTTCSG
jgi:hypothetical protein